MNRRIFIISLAFLFFSHLPASLMADSASEASERIKDRLTQIDALKESGRVGENNLGFLTPRGEMGPREQSMVRAENADRLIIYQTVAGRTGQSIEAVGRQRALQIATRARAGVWLENPGGEWYQKS